MGGKGEVSRSQHRAAINLPSDSYHAGHTRTSPGVTREASLRSTKSFLATPAGSRQDCSNSARILRDISSAAL
jgi:hypothetical protein